MYENKEIIDLTTLCERLGVSLGEVGGITYISEIFTSCVSAVNITAYGEIVKEKSNMRKIIEVIKVSQPSIEGKGHR